MENLTWIPVPSSQKRKHWVVSLRGGTYCFVGVSPYQEEMEINCYSKIWWIVILILYSNLRYQIDKVDCKRVYNIMWVEFRRFSILKIEWDISQLHAVDYMEAESIHV